MERLHEHDPAQRLDDLLPERLTPELGQEADDAARSVLAYCIITRGTPCGGPYRREKPEPLAASLDVGADAEHSLPVHPAEVVV